MNTQTVDIDDEVFGAIEALTLDEELASLDVAALVEAETPKPANNAPSAPQKVAKRRSVTIADLPSEAFVQAFDADKASIVALRPKAKKVAEKFDNLLRCVANDTKPSVFLLECFKALTSTSPTKMSHLVTRLEAAGYSIGTARSQAQQCYKVFALLQIANETSDGLLINASSKIVRFLDKFA